MCMMTYVVQCIEVYEFYLFHLIQFYINSFYK